MRAIRLFLLVCAAFAGAVVTAAAAHADYLLGVGDKLSVSVFGQQQLDHTVRVSADGKIWLPTIGNLEAAGRTIEELRIAIEAKLTQNVSIRAEDINVEIVEFRPFYIVGSVAKPGEYPYRPGLNVRQAIAIAVGFARASADQIEFFAQIDPRTSYATISSEYIHRHARVARLRAELDDQKKYDWEPPASLSISLELRASIQGLEEAEFRARADVSARTASNLEQLVGLANNEIRTLKQQSHRLEKEDERVTSNLAQLRDLQSKGVVSLARIDAFERDVFSSRYARDGTRSQIAAAQTQHAELAGKLSRLVIERKAKISREISPISCEMGALRSQMEAAAAKLEFAGQAVERLCAPWANQEGVFINRRERGEEKVIAATQDSVVQPLRSKRCQRASACAVRITKDQCGSCDASQSERQRKMTDRARFSICG